MATRLATPAAARPAARPAGRVGSEEYHSAPLPTAQEAAVLYSANHAQAAINLLRDEIKDAMGRNNKQAWLMLFDLYQIAANRAEFDALALLFTVKFEQSPPAWIERGADTQGDPRRTQGRERKDFYALKPGPDGELTADIAKFVALAEDQGTVRLDVAKVTTIGADDATLFAGSLAKLRRAQLPMWFNNLEALQRALRATFNEKPAVAQRPYWMLLFELYILQGNAEAFEELALEYAVAFEMSPPNWEVYVNSRAEVVVDMSKVLRIEFAYTSAFFDVVKAIQLAGKRVILMGLSEVNAALLEALGVNRYAILVRRKST